VEEIMCESHGDPGDELLTEELAAIRGELLRIDNKSGTLLTLAAAGFALVASGGPERGVVAGALLAAGLLAAGVAMLQLLFVVRPRLETAWSRRLAGDPSDEAAPGLRIWQRRELTMLSRIVLAKYRALRVAASLLMCALVLMVAAQLAALL
jgi:hypothetical protein